MEFYFKFMLKRFFYIFLVSLSFSTYCFCANEEENNFIVLEKLVNDGLYESAVNQINTFISKYPSSKRIKEVNILLARSYLNLGRTKEAIAILDTFLVSKKYNEFSEQALYLIAEVYYKDKNYKTAMQYYERLKKEFPNFLLSVYAEIASAWYLVELENYNEALKRLEKVLENNPSGHIAEDVTFKIAQVFYLSGKKEQATLWFKKYIEQFPVGANFSNSYYWLAEISYSKGDYSKAIENYQVSAMDKKGVYASASLYGLGWAYWKLNNLEKSIFYFQKAYIEHPDVPFADSVLYKMGRIFFLIGKQDAAIEKLQELYTKFPSSELADDAVFDIADNLSRKGMHTDAIAYYKLGIEKYPYSPRTDEAEYNLYWTLYLAGLEKEALNGFVSIIKNSKDVMLKASSLCRIGDIRLAKKEYELAMEAYDSVLKQYPTSIQADYAQYQIGIVLYQQRKYEASIMAFQSVYVNFPKSIYRQSALYKIGVAYFKSGNYRASVETFSRLLKDYPDTLFKQDALFQTGIAMYNDGRYEDALVVFKDIVKNYSSEEIGWKSKYQIAWIYLQTGKEDIAVKEFEQFIIEYPRSQIVPDILYWLAEYFYEKNDTRSAIRYLKTIIQDYQSSNLKYDAYYLLGLISYNRDQIRPSVSFLEKVVSDNPKSPAGSRSLLLLSRILVEKDNDEEAIKILSGHLKKYPEAYMSSILWQRLGDVYNAQKSYTQAIASYRKAQENAEEAFLPQIHFSIGTCYEEMGKVAEAVTEYLRIPYLFPENLSWKIKAYLRVAKILEYEQKTDDALKLYKNVVNENVPESKFAQERIEKIKSIKK
ncbi:hypothetical protein B9J78_01120 [bacterium Unc6]|nr:hypothetical protein [bacterium Unc6]